MPFVTLAEEDPMAFINSFKLIPSMPKPNKSLQVSAGQHPSKLAWSGAA